MVIKLTSELVNSSEVAFLHRSFWVNSVVNSFFCLNSVELVVSSLKLASLHWVGEFKWKVF